MQARLRIDGTDPSIQGLGVFAQFSGNLGEIRIGRDIMALDIVGHEFTHGMVHHTAMLGSTFVFQSQSLNESFADIFGEMVERHTTGNTNLIIGNQVPAVFQTATGNTQVIRNLLNPIASVPFSQPNFFEVGPRWAFTPDGRGVHQNGGVQNRWFTLLALGGTTTNPTTGNVVTVSPIGLDNAERIAWVNLSTRLGSASNFRDARNGSIDAARAIFGICSNEVLQCIRAWQAVGIDGPIPNSVPQISGTSYICGNDYNNFPFTISACWLPGATFTWNVPSDLGANINGSDLQITHAIGFGNFTITLVATLGNITQTQSFLLTVENCNGGPLQLKIPLNKPSPETIKVYPNPTYDYINIDLPAIDVDKVYNLKVINILGQIVSSRLFTYFDNKIDMSQFADGFYNIILQDNGGSILYSSKVLKQKQK